MSTTSTDPELGRCTPKDVEGLDEAIATWRAAEAEAEKAKQKVGKVMKRLRAKGAQRRWLAHRADVSDQTVTHMSEGRKNWREVKAASQNGTHA